MDFAWAIQQMKQGRWVRRKSWPEDKSITKTTRSYVNLERKVISEDIISLQDFEDEDLRANDWELYVQKDMSFSDR